MKLLLPSLVILVVVLTILSEVESGRIVRTWRRRNMSPARRNYRLSRYMPAPKGPGHMIPRRRSGRFRPASRRNGRRMMNVERRHFQAPHSRFRPYSDFPMPRVIANHQQSLNNVRPLDFGNPIERDPTTHYAPPSSENVKFRTPQKPKSNRGRRPPRPWRRPPSFLGGPSHISIWKMLARKQWMMRRRRPQRPPPPAPMNDGETEEAEVAPVFPNIVYFQPKDLVPPKPTTESDRENFWSSTTNPPEDAVTMKPGFVSDVPLYPTESTSASEFKPVTSKDYIFRVVDYKIIAKQKQPSLLQPAPITASTTSSTTTAPQNAPAPDLVSPTDSTESLLKIIEEPPAPIPNIDLQIDPDAEGSDDFVKILLPPPLPSEPSNMNLTEPIINSFNVNFNTVSNVEDFTTTTTTLKPIIEPVSSTVAEITTTSTTTTTPPTTTTTTTTSTMPPPVLPYKKYPAMPAYKPKKTQPIYPKIITKSNAHSNPSKSDGSSESTSITITGIRSKVKQYKPSGLNNQTHLLTFDKVADGSEKIDVISNLVVTPKSTTGTIIHAVTEKSVVISLSESESKEVPVASDESKKASNSNSTEINSSGGSSTPSPMETFDPLKLIHSWFINTKEKDSSSSISDT